MNVNSFLKSVREGAQPSKAEEIEFLNELHLAFVQHPSNTYLSSLFTADLAHYVEVTIRDDMTPDIKAEAEARASRLANQLQVAAERYQSAEGEIAELKKRIEQLEAQADRIAETAKRNEQCAAKALADLSRYRSLRQNASAFAYTVKEAAMEAWMDGSTVKPEKLRALLQRYYDADADTNDQYEAD